MTDTVLKEGPIISLTRAHELQKRTGRDYDACIRFLEAQALGQSYRQAARTWADCNEHVDLSPLQAAAVMNQIRMVDRELSEQEAEADGKLWSICGAVRVGHVDYLIFNGRGGNALEANLTKTFPGAAGIITEVVMGEKKDARTRAATLCDAESLSIRFVEEL